MPSGLDFFDVAAQALALGTGCRWAGIGRLQRGEKVQVISLWNGDRLSPPFSFDLDRPPCEADAEASDTFPPRGVGDVFPCWPAGSSSGAPNYRAEVFRNRDGQPVGHVFVVSEDEIDDSPGTCEFFRLVSQRVGAEYNRFQAEEALATSRSTLESYETMVAAISDQMAFVDTHYVYRAVNSSYVQACTQQTRHAGDSLSREDILGHTVTEVLGAPFFAAKVKPHLDRCFAGHEVSAHIWIEPPGSGRRCLHTHFHPHRGADGSIQGAVVVLRDQTRRRHQQTRLAELAGHEAVVSGDFETAAALITEAAAEALEVERVGIWMMDPDGQEVHCRDLFERSSQNHGREIGFDVADCLGYCKALEAGRAIEAHDATADSRIPEKIRQSYAARDIVSTLDAPIRISGQLLGVLCHQQVGCPRIWQAAETRFAKEAADLVAQAAMNHDRRNLERRLHQAQKMESLGVLAGGIAHDFNNLLVGILGGADLALSNLGQDDNRTLRNIQMVRKAAVRASDLCSQMLAYAGKGQFVLETVDLSTEIEAATDLLRAALSRTAVLDFQLLPGLPLIEVDTTQLRQIVMNLITNASEALAETSGCVTLRTGRQKLRQGDLEHGLWGYDLEPGEYVFLEVTDTGCGMDPETRSRIFEPFFSTKFTGRGLGLAAVLGIVRSHFGAIAIESEPGSGTTVRIYLPFAPATVMEPSVEIESYGLGTGTLLVIDDESTVRQVAEEILEGSGFTCLLAEDGQAGLRLLGRHPEIDAVFLDLTMPHMSGAETFDEIRRQNRDIPIILTSGYSEDDVSRRFADRDIAGFIHKPFHATKLLGLVHRLLLTRAIQA